MKNFDVQVEFSREEIEFYLQRFIMVHFCRSESCMPIWQYIKLSRYVYTNIKEGGG